MPFECAGASRRWLVWLVVPLGILVLWKLCFAYTVNEAWETQQRLQRIQLTELDRQLVQFSFIPRILAGDSEIKSALRSSEPANIAAANKRLQATQKDSGLDFAFLLDAHGMTVASSNWADPISFVGVNYAFRPYFKSAIGGNSATFFAVGATTGLPGYFIAEPVVFGTRVEGVVVAKIALDVLVDSWSELPYDSVVGDDFGVVILSTREDLLYTPTSSLSERERSQLASERRYALRPARLAWDNASPVMKSTLDGETGGSYFLFGQALRTEPWSLLNLVSERTIQWRALVLTSALASAALICFLLTRLYQQQRRLVRSEQRNSLELEEQVQMRTSELARAQQRLISESNFSMLGRMSAAINHEINQPLASLRLNLASLRTMMERGDSDAGEIEQIVIDSDRTTKRIARVIRSLRSLARRGESRFAEVDLAQLISEVHNTVQRERPAASSCLKLSIGDGRWFVLADEVLVQQALLNLLYNAFDAVLVVDEPEILLSLEAGKCSKSGLDRSAEDDNPGCVVIAVTDNGQGVSPTAREALFEPFATTRQQSDGLGLGLTIARQIAQDHGGEILYSRCEVGSCFSLTLPLSSYAEQRIESREVE